jgi:hypothetical protein
MVLLRLVLTMHQKTGVGQSKEAIRSGQRLVRRKISLSPNNSSRTARKATLAVNLLGFVSRMPDYVDWRVVVGVFVNYEALSSKDSFSEHAAYAATCAVLPMG